MNSEYTYIAVVRDLNDEYLTAFLIKTDECLYPEDIKQEVLNALNDEGGEWELNDLKFELFDTDESIYNVIDLRKEKTNE